MGDDPIPSIQAKATVQDFGARGDGVTDDTQAFLKAIAAVDNGALFVPAGKYRITQPLLIKKSNFVLRGEGPDKTTLYFPQPLYDMVGKGGGGGWSGWSWSGGVISIQGSENGSSLASVIAPALRGDTTLTLSSAAKISAGQAIRLVLYEDAAGTLMDNILHSGGSFAKRVEHVSRVASVQGNMVTLESPLRTDLQLSWKPTIFAYSPTVKETGIENLTIEFPNVSYAGHFNEPGYNGILLKSVSDCWVRDVTIRNADGGIFLESGTRFSTIEGLRLTGRGGHHGIEMDSFSESNLITGFQFDNTFIHDVTVQFLVHGNVFSQGRGANLNLDHHRAAPFENLFSDIDIGRGSRAFASAGDPGWGGTNSAARETFWNIYRSDGTVLSKGPNWPQVNVIAGSDPDDLYPADIHLAQLALRLGQPTPSPAPAPSAPIPSSPVPAPSAPTPSSPSSPSVPYSADLVLTGDPAIGPYAVEAKTNVPGSIKVEFYVDGNLFRVESSAPYSLFGDNGRPYSGTLGTGTHLVEAKVSSQTATTLVTLARASAQTATPLAEALIAFVEGSTMPPTAPAPSAPLPPAPSVNGSLLINSKTMLSNSGNFASDHPVEHLWDGCLEGTPQCSSGSGRARSFWVEFDLGKLHDLASARLFGDADGTWWSTSWTLEYKQTINDPWTTAFTADAFLNDWSTQPINAVGRYVRVHVLGNQKRRATQARELEIYGTPLEDLVLSSP
jgi:hypothetical protein